MRKQRRSTKLIAVLAGVALVAAACGDDDDGPDEEPGTTDEEAAPDETDPEDESDTTDAEDPDTTDAEDPETPEGEDELDAVAVDVSEPLPEPDDLGEVGGSGCGIPYSGWEENEVQPQEVRFAWNDPLLSFNADTQWGNAAANQNPLYLMNGSRGGFWYYNDNLQLVNNEEFGTCTVESLDPLTVTYTINEDVTWSDGTPVDAADLVIYWASQSTHFNTLAEDAGYTPDPETGELVDEEGNPAEFDEVYFDAAAPSMELIEEFPEISDDGQSVTATWSRYYLDYQLAGLLVSNAPAHILGRHALGVDDPMEAKAAVIDALQNEDQAAIKEIADLYNTGWNHDQLPADEDFYVSYGPYTLERYEQRDEMEFTYREDYTWGPTPSFETIIYRIIGDPTAAVQALENEEIDIFEPQAEGDTPFQVAQLHDRGVETIATIGSTYEHVDLVFDNGGPFDPATYGGDEETALAVRHAFMKSIPRQEIMDRLISPIDSEATTRDSFNAVPGAPNYDDLTADELVAEHAGDDIDGAVALLEEAGVDTPIEVRFHFADDNPRRANQYELIRDAAAQAGFEVIDGRSPNWGPELADTNIYDASLFGWQSTNTGVATSNANYITGGQNNYGGYSSEAMDSLYDELEQTTEEAGQTDLLAQIEELLWQDGYGTVIFQHPALLSYNTNYVTGLSYIPLSPTSLWNFWEWQPA